MNEKITITIDSRKSSKVRLDELLESILDDVRGQVASGFVMLTIHDDGVIALTSEKDTQYLRVPAGLQTHKRSDLTIDL